MEEEKKEQKQKFQLKELFTNRQYRSIFILVFYAILFIVLISLIRSPKSLDNHDKNSNYQVFTGYELIHDNNFAYKYTVTLDEEVIYYEGKKNGSKEVLTVYNASNLEEYYFDESHIYLIKDGYYIEEMKPYFIFDFFDTTVVEALIKRGSSIAESLENFQIDNQDLYDVLNNDSLQVDSGDNYITLSYRNSYITGITFDLSNYAKMMGKKYERVTITLEYYDFNLIEEILVDTN